MAKYSVMTKEFEAIRTALEVLEPLDETQRQFAVTMILSRLGMTAAPAAALGLGDIQARQKESPAESGSRPPDAAGGGTGLKGISVKEFMKKKAPATDLERFICLAFYLIHAREMPSFKTADITKLNAEALGVDFANAAATATNAVKQSRLLSSAGGGRKRITTRGESLVEALPDRGKVKEIVRSAPHRSRSKARAARQKSAK
jgi:hypothetical protein